METFKGLQPEIVWKYFYDICQVPRPSKQEEQIIDFLMDFGKSNNLETKKDEAGNVLISKPATKGMEGIKSVVLQSHMDMVCEKNSDVDHDFTKDPIVPFIDGEWVRATGTTLGADCGIGMATQLAILSAGPDSGIEHGPLECLFTVDEETGLTGAFALQPGFLNSTVLLNLDSEDEGEIFIGCAGGIDTLASFPFKQEPVPDGYISLKVSVTGLKGGHSGDDIDKGLGNANKVLTRCLWDISGITDMRLAYIDGGNLRNAIAREAFAIISVSGDQSGEVKNRINALSEIIKKELSVTEPGLILNIGDIDPPAFVIDKVSTDKLIRIVYSLPHGVISMHPDIEGLVQTSTNLASVKIEDNTISITTSQRSSIDSGKDDIARMVASVFKLAGVNYEHTDGYPGWAPDTNSEILKIAVDSYERLFSVKPVVRAIHAGLECGLFLEKYPGLDMISFGPTMRGVHSPDERLNTGTVLKFWDHLIDVLKHVPER